MHSESEAGPAQPASAVYWARVSKLKGDRLLGFLFGVVEFLLALWTPGDGPDPRYRVLVGRVGETASVGVREARTRRQAERDLSGVQAILDRSTVADAQAALSLDA